MAMIPSTYMDHILPATKRLATSSRTSNSSSCSSTSSTGSNDSDIGIYDCEDNSRDGDYYKHQEGLCTPRELLPMNGARRGKWTFEEERFTERI